MAVDLPPGGRPPLALPHARSDEKAFGRAAFGLGHTRRRRQFRTVAQTATVQWRIPHSQLPLWNDWYEDDLQAGALSFLMQVQSRRVSSELETVEATFIDPPKITISIGWATISGEVRLFFSELIVTSRPYPLYSYESMSTVMTLAAGSLNDLVYPPESLNTSMALASGSLFTLLLNYGNWPAESLDSGMQVVSGTLQTALQNYEGAAEGLDSTMAVASGSLVTALITINTWTPEGLDTAASVTQGSLE
jgi:hypothetical protein